MHFKYSAIAASMIAALSLTGCGSDSSSNNSGNGQPPVAVQSQGAFIDAAVEGLYYVTQPSGKTGYTDAEGTYNFDEKDESITFYLGGENGLRIGTSSIRDIISPFEATGNYQKALNLARILQTMDDASDNAITLPDTIKSPSAGMIAALQNVMLHDLDSADSLKKALGKTEWISEDKALDHLNNSLAGLERGSKEVLTDWQKGSGKYLRTIESTLSAQNAGSSNEQLFVHADKLLEEELFDTTRGFRHMTVKLDDTNLVLLKGSNDTTISSGFATSYLACLDKEGVSANYVAAENNNHATCNGTEMDFMGDEFDYAKFSLANAFDYSILYKKEELAQDESYPWSMLESDGEGPMFNCLANQSCSESSLTGFSITERDDSDDEDGSEIQQNVLSHSYDAITGVYTEVRQRTMLNGQYKGRVSNSINFNYIVESPTAERYVDFKGTWKAVATREGCDGVAVSTLVFDDNGLASMTGEEFSGQCERSSLDEKNVSYDTLSAMDYWWFATNGQGNDSKATLTQLNSTIRWCDKDEDNQTEGCQPADIKINRWEYAPAGKNWDQGVLNRRTLDSNGNIKSTISMHKL
ncbi:hypothetical protein [Photobacterium rosenbergii]|uniref:Chromosome partitioning protein ParA n=1 Tax=Photobacterium rosenbergii TaxID=294936 RepID=A0ABU3ZP96_9GAMM|nr:hypothetical protein [Photobacterium rosenbergii]MDV5171882.1 hypothetical protein [Photobacterium rosenbergii]